MDILKSKPLLCFLFINYASATFAADNLKYLKPSRS